MQTSMHGGSIAMSVDNSSVGSNSDSGTEEGSQSQTRSLKRPIGRDAAKAAKKSNSGASGSQRISKYTSMLSEMHIQRLNFWMEAEGSMATKIEKLVAVAEDSMKRKKERDDKLVALREREVRLDELKEDERIMAIDLSACNLGQCVLYEALQAEILQRRTSRDA